MSRKFKLVKDYYDAGYDLYQKTSISIRKGVTTLVGCNGSGKTTLLHLIKQKLEKENIPYISYDNKTQGGRTSMEKLLFYGRMEELAHRAFSSEGEEIVLNFGDFVSQIRNFFKTGKSSHSFNEPNPEHKERWILFDAVDSGMSIDNMKDIKELFKIIIQDAKRRNIDLYIVISTNSFELAKELKCFDVFEGKYIKFKTYDEYSKFILKSRKSKEERYNE